MLQVVRLSILLLLIGAATARASDDAGTVNLLADLVADEYFDAEVAKQASQQLRDSLAAGRYDNAPPEELAALLTKDLLATTHDKHLVVSVTRPAPARAREDDGKRRNFGVQRVEVLPGNVGYLNLTAFCRPEEAGDAIAAAMKVLSNAEALILDLRENGGGAPDTVALVASYLFDGPSLPLFEIVPRYGKGGGRYVTQAVPGRHGTRPIFVLTSSATFSGGEGLAFLLQERGRAKVIGERTAGAANPGRPYRIDATFEVTIPNGRLSSVVAGKNWEGAGVVPDVKVDAAEALSVAHARALETLRSQAKQGDSE
jgi:C-terminal processing protease CtpA/Prc